MPIQTSNAYKALGLARAGGQARYGKSSIMMNLCEDHPNPAVTSCKFAWVRKTPTNWEVCIKLNTGEERSAYGDTEMEATANAAAAFSV